MCRLKLYCGTRALIVLALAVVFAAGEAVFSQIKVSGVTITLPEKVRKTEKAVAKDEAAKPAQTPATTGNNTRRVYENPAWLDYRLDSIRKMQGEVDAYTAGKQYLYESAEKPYILFAVSKREREKWYRELNSESALTPEHRAKLDAALDGLAASAAKKLPMYKPGPQNFAIRNPAGERLILQKLKERLGGSSVTVYKSGFYNNWQIYKDNIGLPQYRFMRGYIYAKNAADDNPYCHLYYISVSQNYAGGGTYGSSHATFEDDLIFGCP